MPFKMIPIGTDVQALKHIFFMRTILTFLRTNCEADDFFLMLNYIIYFNWNE